MSENKEKEIIINGVNVNGCEYLFNNKKGHWCDLNCLTAYGHNSCDVVCSYNPDCYYKQLQRFSEYLPIVARLAKLFKTFKEVKGIEYDGILSEWIEENEKLKKTLKEIAEIAKTKIYTPICFEDPDCPKNGGVGIDNDCDEYCPLITIERISEKIKEVENDK